MSSSQVRLTADAEVATVLGSIPASSATLKSEEGEMKGECDELRT